jgi:hypothetical protein
MSRYYFHLRTGAGLELTDEEGDVLPDIAAVEEHAISSIKELVRGSGLDWSRCSYEIHDSENRHVMTVWFREAAAGTSRRKQRSPSGDHHA